MATREDLLHILSANRALFQFPGEKFRRYLRDLLRKDPDKEIAKYKKEYFTPRRELLKTINLDISPLAIGMYNATLDTGVPVDIPRLLAHVKEVGLIESGPFKVTECTVRYGKFKTAVKITSEYGLVANDAVPSNKYVSVDFKLKVTTGNGVTKGASFSYYKSGKVRFSGGHIDTPKDLVTFFSRAYNHIGANVPIKFNNITSEFKIGFPLKTALIYGIFSDPHVKSYFGEYHIVAKYTKKNFLYLAFGDAFSIVIADTGVVQIQGTTDVEDAYATAKKFFVALKDNDFLVIARNAVQAARLNAPQKTKLAKRRNNLPAPNVTRRGTTCPVKRRPNPYGYDGVCPAKCYVKPNPQGQPCCYGIPESREYSRNKVANAYKKAGVKVPDAVRKLFGIGNRVNNRPVNVANVRAPVNIRTFVNNKTGFMINTRQCLRYTKVALVDIASRLKIVLPKKLTKPILCTLIKQKTAGAAAANNNKQLVTGANKELRLGRRLCHTYPKATLVKFAKEMGGAIPPGSDKASLCALIEQLARAPKKKKTPNRNRNQNENRNENFNYFMAGPRGA